MSHDPPNQWPNVEAATLPLIDRLFWLSLVLMVIGGGAWRVQQELVEQNKPQIALARTKRNLGIDAMPTGSIARRAKY